MRKIWIPALIFAACLMIGAAQVPGPVVLERVKSLYNGELTVLDYQGERYLLAQSRLGDVLHSAMDTSKKDRLILDYLQVMALLTGMHSQPLSVYNLGLGGGELIRFHLHQFEKSQIDSAEIDAQVVTVAKKYFDVLAPRHRILEGEGFDILKRQAKKYDVIWVDDIISKEGPKAYIKAEHLNALRDRLAEGGILVANMGEAPESKYFSEVERDYRRGYSHGIRIKSPIPQYAQTLQTLRAAAFPNRSSSIPTLLPTYLIAVGNQASLTCAHFWEHYLKWTNEKLISIKWGQPNPAQSRDLCEELK